MAPAAVQAALFGVILGAATGIPLGVVNVAIVDAASRAGRRHATGIGLGGALADTVHAGLAFVGVAPLIARQPSLMRALAAVSALVIVAYAVRVWRARPAPASAEAVQPASLGRGVLVGLSLTLPNPAPLLAWIAIAAAILPEARPLPGIAGALGVGVGSAAWFALLAHLAARGVLGGRAGRWLPRVVAIALIALAIASAVRAAIA